MNTSRQQQLLSMCLGYYDGVEAPTLLSPFHTGDEFPELTQVHESVHRELAEANATDNYARLAATILRVGKDELPVDIRKELGELSASILRSSVFVHEALACYLSLWVFHRVDASRVALAISRLPQFYRAAFEAMAMSFGSLDEATTPPYGDYVPPLALGVAIAALNLPLMDIVPRLDNLSELRARIQQDSPNRRFADLLGSLRPPSSPGILQTLLHAAHRDNLATKMRSKEIAPDHPYCEIQLRLFSSLAQAVPLVRFVPDRSQLRMWSRSVWESSTQQLVRRGHSFMERVVLRSISKDTETVETKLETDVRLPGVDPTFPIDMSLACALYLPASEDRVPQFLSLCAQRQLCAHVFVAADPRSLDINDVESSPCLAAFLAEGPDERRFLLAPDTKESDGLSPFFCLMPFRDLARTVHSLAAPRILARIDERQLGTIHGPLRAIGLPVFVLAHDTRISNLIEVVSSFTKSGKVFLLPIGLSQTATFCAICQQSMDTYYISPMTGVTWILLNRRFEGEAAVEFLDADSPLSELSIDVRALTSVVALCFAATPEMRSLSIDKRAAG